MNGTTLQGESRLLSLKKPIWAAQLHNLRAQLLAVRDRMQTLPEELRRPIVPIAYSISNAAEQLAQAINSLDQDTRDSLKHYCEPDPAKETK